MVGNRVLGWGKIFGEVVRGAQFCLKGRTAFEGGGESRRLPRSAQPAAFGAACRVRRSRTRQAAQVCEWRRLSEWMDITRSEKAARMQQG